ncbi:hypothetical protein PHLGIDRAFT_120792 [Phlebiopsis gigantea 11061_1 CR5-6]|uniref:F-box domain-containing protein n=1 Tax=Phlebiopsis gigantea (strain 11061_1 CR5-6) TaxID=745531 RepID=A0A0C3S6Y4_PHLG1|nr:hypothetical protein PHLGIDRAFT_120792 [Phlebiopsis gigantea 11061_1 CR5-6]
MGAVHHYHSLAFPEEIIPEILNYNLRVSHTEFFGRGCYDTINRRREIRKLAPAAPPPCSAALLVCKRWLRIGTPLLYESVKLSKLRDTKAVLGAGGFGRALGDLAKYLYNAEHLFILPDVQSRESITGLHLVLLELNLRTLKIEHKRAIVNRNTDYINGLLQHSIRHYWPNLKQIALDTATNITTGLVGALRDAPGVEEFVLTESVVALWMSNGILERIMENPSLERVVCHDKPFLPANEASIRERLTLPKEMKAKIHFVSVLEDTPVTLGPLPRRTPEMIWCREYHLRKNWGPGGGINGWPNTQFLDF